MSRETLRSVALVAIPLALLAAAFGACFERRTEKVPVGYSHEALSNPYLALERLLARMGREVVSLDGLGSLDALPPTDASLLIPTQRDTLSAERSRSLLDWVERGGHLLVVTWTMWEDEDRRPDLLLDRFGVQQHWAETPEEDESDPEEGDVPAEEEADIVLDETTEVDLDALAALFGVFTGAPSEWDVAELEWPGRSGSLALFFDPRFHWVDSEGRASWLAAGPAGTHLLAIEHGEGWITALTDDWLLRNDHVGSASHAEFLVRLMGQERREGPVWIVASSRWPGLWSQAVKYATPVLVSFSALLAAWLWRTSRRFGPLQPVPPPKRRSWFEHLEAAGHYHWREGRGRALVRSTRDRVLRDLARRRPQLARLARSERDARIAELAELRTREVRGALGEAPMTGEEFPL